MTYNTLIDVYGKLGRWEDALQVLQRMKAQVGALCILHLDVCAPQTAYAKSLKQRITICASAKSAIP